MFKFNPIKQGIFEGFFQRITAIAGQGGDDLWAAAKYVLYARPTTALTTSYIPSINIQSRGIAYRDFTSSYGGRSFMPEVYPYALSISIRNKWARTPHTSDGQIYTCRLLISDEEVRPDLKSLVASSMDYEFGDTVTLHGSYRRQYTLEIPNITPIHSRNFRSNLRLVKSVLSTVSFDLDTLTPDVVHGGVSYYTLYSTELFRGALPAEITQPDNPLADGAEFTDENVRLPHTIQLTARSEVIASKDLSVYDSYRRITLAVRDSAPSGIVEVDTEFYTYRPLVTPSDEPTLDAEGYVTVPDHETVRIVLSSSEVVTNYEMLCSKRVPSIPSSTSRSWEQVGAISGDPKYQSSENGAMLAGSSSHYGFLYSYDPSSVTGNIDILSSEDFNRVITEQAQVILAGVNEYPLSIEMDPTPLVNPATSNPVGITIHPKLDLIPTNTSYTQEDMIPRIQNGTVDFDNDPILTVTVTKGTYDSTEQVEGEPDAVCDKKFIVPWLATSFGTINSVHQYLSYSQDSTRGVFAELRSSSAKYPNGLRLPTTGYTLYYLEEGNSSPTLCYAEGYSLVPAIHPVLGFVGFDVHAKLVKSYAEGARVVLDGLYEQYRFTGYRSRAYAESRVMPPDNRLAYSSSTYDNLICHGELLDTSSGDYPIWDTYYEVGVWDTILEEGNPLFSVVVSTIEVGGSTSIYNSLAAILDENPLT